MWSYEFPFLLTDPTSLGASVHDLLTLEVFASKWSKQMQRLQDIAATLAILAGLAFMVLAVSPAHAGVLDHQPRPVCFCGGFGD